MTQPIEAYISVVACDCVREMKQQKLGPDAVVASEYNGYLVIVACGAGAKVLKKGLALVQRGEEKARTEAEDRLSEDPETDFPEGWDRDG